jgi:hypothetical protein
MKVIDIAIALQVGKGGNVIRHTQSLIGNDVVAIVIKQDWVC